MSLTAQPQSLTLWQPSSAEAQMDATAFVAEIVLSVDALVVAFPFLLPEDELLDLASRRLGQLAEFYRARAFEVGDTLAAELHDVLAGHLHCRAFRDEGFGHLTPSGVRDTDDADLQHRRVFHDDLLHLLGRDVFAAGDDDVLGAVFQLDVVVRVPDGQVTGMEPVPLEGFGSGIWLLIIPRHDVVPAHDHLTHSLAIARHVFHVVIHHPQPRAGDDIRHALARLDRGAFLQGQPLPAGLEGADRVRAIGFGKTVHMVDRRA